MAYRTNNLHLFINLSNADDYIKMWHELDNDYKENGLAKEIVNNIFKELDDRDSFIRLNEIMAQIRKGHSTYSTQLQHHSYQNEDGKMIVAVSYLT